MERRKQKNPKMLIAEELWKRIPKPPQSLPVALEQDIIRKLIDLFHIGSYYYFVFNSQTFKHESSGRSSSFNILEYSVEEMTIEKMIESFHPQDLPYFYQFEADAHRFWAQLPEEKYFKYKFSYDIRILDKDGEYKRVLMQVIPFSPVEEGGVRTLNIMTIISHLKQEGTPALSYIGLDGEPSFYNVDVKIPFPYRQIQTIFTKREKEILSYIVSGKTSNEIAGLLCRSKFTVDTHRRNILEKSGCRNLNELISKTIKEGWV